MRPAPDADSQGSRVLQPPKHLVSPRFSPPAPPLPARTLLPCPSLSHHTTTPPLSLHNRARHRQRWRTRRAIMPRKPSPPLSTWGSLKKRALALPLLFHLSSPSPLHTRLHFLTSFFLLSNPSLCPSTCLPLPQGVQRLREAAALQRYACCNLASPRAQEECERHARPATQ